MTAVARKLVARGNRHNVFYGVCKNGDVPAAQMLDALQVGEWRVDTDHDPADGWPDSRQPDHRVKLMVLINQFANTGSARLSHQINRLEDGVWEFKVAKKRVTFYDTDGRGNSSNRSKLSTPGDCPRGANDPCWFVPDFDRQIRLGHAFPKDSQRTDPLDIAESKRVRNEDLEHDRAA